MVAFPANRPECRDTSGIVIELPAVNLNAHQGNVRQTTEKNVRKGQEGVAFCPVAHKRTYIRYLHHMAFTEERSAKLCVSFLFVRENMNNYHSNSLIEYRFL